MGKKGVRPKNFEVFLTARRRYVMTDEQKKKKSDDYKAKGIKPPSRKGIPSWNKGKKNIYSEETRKSISKSVSEYLKHNPINFTEEVRKKIGDAHRGEKSTFWKGGVSKINRSERKIITETPEYNKWRRIIFERDDFTCQKCKKRGGKLRCHHIKKFSDYPKLRLELLNGITICERCDNKFIIHREQKWESYFFEILIERGYKIPKRIYNIKNEYRRTDKNT